MGSESLERDSLGALKCTWRMDPLTILHFDSLERRCTPQQAR
jgi:hypothetical protein